MTVEQYTVGTEPPPRKVEDWYLRFWDYHCNEEQVARFFGDEDEERKHHDAAIVVFRAMTAEQVPT